MEIDLELHPARAATFRSQVCIVGAGIAGLTLAHRLNRMGIAVALLEAGGHTITDLAQQAVAQAQLTGTPHMGTREGRFRVLGGSGLRWGGQLLPMRVEHDADSAEAGIGSFQHERPDHWPLDPAALSPHYREVERLLGVDDLPYEGGAFFRHAHMPVPALLTQMLDCREPVELREPPDLVAEYSKWAPFSRRNLAATVGSALLDSRTTTVYLHAQVTELLPTASGARLGGVLVRTASGGAFRFAAEHFVLAAGTVETVRLLLASRSVDPAGVGNAQDQVGRNFHDHLTVPVAQIGGTARQQLLQQLGPWVLPAHEFSGAPDQDAAADAGSTLHSVKLAASSLLCQRLGINPVLAHLTLEEPEGSGLAAVRELLHAAQQGELRSALATHAAQLPRAAVDALRLAWAAKVHGRRFVSAAAAVTLRLNAAQDAPSLSRITLMEDRDARQVPQVRVDWRVSAHELFTLRSFALYLRQRFTGLGLDGLQWVPELFVPEAALPGLEDARHAMGGACMGTDPRSSVVSPELAVHGVANLWVASAATFPTGSAQLPTLPLMALSLRLADRLNLALQR